MPTSQHLQIATIMDFIISTNPSKLLDIGVGFGKYGFLSREYLELWDGRDEFDNWIRTIDGIEIHDKYITPVHTFIYDNIYIGNALDVLPELNKDYDLILIIDVLEHFNYEDGLKLIYECTTRGKNVLISVPNHMIRRVEAFGNRYEAHLFQWERSHFGRFPQKIILPNVGGSLIVYIGERSRGLSLENRFISLSGFPKRPHYVYYQVQAQLISLLDIVHLKKPLKRLLNRGTH